MVEIRASEVIPLQTVEHSYFRILDANGKLRFTRVVVSPENLRAVQSAMGVALDQYAALKCADVLSPQSPVRSPIASWGKYLSENYMRVVRPMEWAQGTLLGVTGVGAALLAAGALVYHASPIQQHSQLKEYLNQPLEYLANIVGGVFGLAVISHIANWLMHQPYRKYQHCAELKERITELYDVASAIGRGERPEKEPQVYHIGRKGLHDNCLGAAVLTRGCSPVRRLPVADVWSTDWSTPSWANGLAASLAALVIFAVTRGVSVPALEATMPSIMGGKSLMSDNSQYPTI